MRRLIWGVCVVFFVVTIVFFISRVIPGDPARIIAGELATPEDIEKIRSKLGLDKPLIEQYKGFLKGLIRGNLGESFFFKEPVIEVILRRFPNTVLLAVLAVLFSCTFGIPLGIISAFAKTVDRFIIVLTTGVYSIPNFWLGAMLILIFSVKLGILPVSGFESPAHLVLPVITLGLSLTSVVARFTRNSTLSALSSEFVKFAESKGLPKTAVIVKHALRSAMLPVVTVISLQLGVLLSGAVVTETVFAFPGVGRLLFQSAIARDYPLLQGCVMFIASVWVLVNMFADLIYARLDPRVR